MSTVLGSPFRWDEPSCGSDDGGGQRGWHVVDWVSALAPTQRGGKPGFVSAGILLEDVEELPERRRT
jgi:hypothetical protein